MKTDLKVYKLIYTDLHTAIQYPEALLGQEFKQNVDKTKYTRAAILPKKFREVVQKALVKNYLWKRLNFVWAMPIERLYR